MNFQIADEEVVPLRVMSKIGGSKRELFIDKMTSEQPVMLSKFLTSPSGTTFLNYSTIIRNVPAHSIKFKFSPPLKPNSAKIASLFVDL